MRFVIIFRAFLVAALTALGVSFGAATAEAYPICAGASVSGAAGSYGVNQCVPYSGSTLCHWDRVSVGSLLAVTLTSCHPW